MFKFAPL